MNLYPNTSEMATGAQSSTKTIGFRVVGSRVFWFRVLGFRVLGCRV